MAGDVFDKGDPKKLFKLLNKLATGSYGTVFKAQNKKTSETVALKVIALEENDSLDEFLPEITIMRALNHPNVVKLHGAWKKGHDLFIAMELCGGGAASVNKPVPEAVIQVILRDALKALDFIHEKSVIHRDIKAANILLANDGAIKLTDFGVSAQMSCPSDKRKSFIGTPYWLAPEVVMVNLIYQPYSNKVDIWSLGITGIELAETKPPRFGLDPTKAMNEIPRSPPPRLAEEMAWSAGFHAFLAQALEKNPDKRPTARELLKHTWLSDCGEVALVGAYVQKTQRGEWDPSTGRPPPPPSPPVAQTTLDHMTPTTVGRRMTKASIDELLRLQTSAPLDGAAPPPVLSAVVAQHQPPGPGTQMKPPLKKAPSLAALQKPAPPTRLSPASLSSYAPSQPPAPLYSPPANGEARADLEAASSLPPHRSPLSEGDTEEAAMEDDEAQLQPAWTRPPPSKPPPPVPKKRPSASIVPMVAKPTASSPPPASVPRPVPALTAVSTPARLPPPLRTSPRPQSVFPNSFQLPPPPPMPRAPLVVTSPLRLPPPPPAPVLATISSSAAGASHVQHQHQHQPQPPPRAVPRPTPPSPLLKRVTDVAAADDVRVPPRPARASPQRPERPAVSASNESLVSSTPPPRRPPPQRALSPSPQERRPDQDSNATMHSTPTTNGPQALLAMAMLGKPPALRRTQAPHKAAP